MTVIKSVTKTAISPIDEKPSILNDDKISDRFDYYIGVDGGGTKCRARIVGKKGIKLAEGVSGPANIRIGMDIAIANIKDAINQALLIAKIGKDQYCNINIGLGLAGVADAHDAAKVAEYFSDFKKVAVSTDSHIACMGAFKGREGGIIIAGTGSIAYAWVGDKSYKFGGWGFELRDVGSGSDIGRQAIIASIRAYDGLIKPSELTETIMYKFEKPLNIVRWVKTALPRDYAEFSPLVFDYAKKGDLVACEIIKNAALYIDKYVKRLCEIGCDNVALVGGISEPIRPYLSKYSLSILKYPAKDSLGGAIMVARGCPTGIKPAGAKLIGAK